MSKKWLKGLIIVLVIMVAIVAVLAGYSYWLKFHTSQLEGKLDYISDCVGTAESSPVCGYVFRTQNKVYMIQGEGLVPYTGKYTQYVGVNFRVSGKIFEGGKNRFGLPEPSVIDVKSMTPL